jgi:hypothetical protein
MDQQKLQDQFAGIIHLIRPGFDDFGIAPYFQQLIEKALYAAVCPDDHRHCFPGHCDSGSNFQAPLPLSYRFEKPLELFSLLQKIRTYEIIIAFVPLFSFDKAR